jgi:hypothetical protein
MLDQYIYSEATISERLAQGKQLSQEEFVSGMVEKLGETEEEIAGKATKDPA